MFADADNQKLLGYIMFKKTMITIVLCLACVALACADESQPAAKYYNFAGKSYIAFPTFSSNSTFDPNGNGVQIPMLVNLEQNGKMLYGCLYYAEPLEGEGIQPSVIFEKIEISEGIVSKSSAKFDLSGSYLEGRQVSGSIVVANGKTIMSFDLIGKGPKLKLDLLEIAPEDKLSGIYVGLMAPATAAPAQKFNLFLGVYNKDGVIRGASGFADPAGWARFRDGTGVYNSKTGKMSLKDPDQRLQANGTFQNDKISFHSESYDDPIVGILFKNGYLNKGKPKAKKPSPRKVSAGESREVVFKCSNVSPGLKVRLTRPEGYKEKAVPLIYIKKFTLENNLLKVNLFIDEKAKGNFNFELINPDGQKSVTKKNVIKIK